MSLKLNIKELNSKPNPDLVRERTNSNVEIGKLHAFFGKLLFASADRHKHMMALSVYKYEQTIGFTIISDFKRFYLFTTKKREKNDKPIRTN